ncbi:MAG: pentapeptide repeat-containing protein, partial [Dolichospermum sp.]
FSDLSGANLSGTNLHDADLIRVKLNSANLTGADLTDASFSDTDFTGANLTGANLSGYHYVGDFVNFQGANLTDANLNSDDLKGCDSSQSYESFDNCQTDYPGQKKGVSFYQAIYNQNTQFPNGVDPEVAVADPKFGIAKNKKCGDPYNRYNRECVYDYDY